MAYNCPKTGIMVDFLGVALQYFSLIGVPLLAFLFIIMHKAKEESEPNCLERADRYLDELENKKQA